MTLDQLKDVLLSADPAAVLVSPRLLGLIIKRVHKLGNRHLSMPHSQSLVIDRHLLFRYIEQDELRLDADRLLPRTVILLAQPAPERLKLLGQQVLLLEFRQRLFHAKVHVALEQRFPLGTKSLGEVRGRIHEIGQTEFEEIRTVLRQERLLFPSTDDRQLYIEFAAVFLELRFFVPKLVTIFFPNLRDPDRIDRLLARDVDGAALFQTTRLPGAPDAAVSHDDESDQPNELYWQLLRRADQAAKSGNTVRAALCHSQAAAVAPRVYEAGARADAQRDLERLATRLQTALRLSDEEAQEWLRCLPPLIKRADQGEWTVEARLLYELQRVCADHENDIYTLDLVEWALSLGRRPIQRPLPSQRFVRTLRHLQSASQRLEAALVPAAEREVLGRLLRNARHQGELRLRARFRPILSDALSDVGLRPGNAPERTAAQKIVEELMDRIVAHKFLTFSDLRDALSRNNLKLHDLTDPQDFARGDALLRLDRRLATMLDGVYRPSEAYLRWLQRLTSLNFGTQLGRMFTNYVTIPFGGALVVMEGLELLQGSLAGPGHEPSFGPLSLLLHYFAAPQDAHPVFPLLGLLNYLLLALIFMGLIHLESLRQRFRQVGSAVLRNLRRVFVELPAKLLPWPLMRAAWKSWPWQLFLWYFVRPLLVFGLLWAAFPQLATTSWRALTTLAAVTLLVNSRPGRAASSAIRFALLQTVDWLRAGLVQNVVRVIAQVFKRITDSMEYVLFSVDEWLRFRRGDNRLALAARLLLGLIWFPVSYLARLYMVVLIEPGLNPLKLPVSILAAKFVYPLSIAIGLERLLADPLEPLVGWLLAHAVAWSTVYFLPDAFGFLFWETKENWSLYEGNRRAALRPVVVGPHGEQMVQLLRPGFHSGTLPRLYARLRRAEVLGHRSGVWRSARTLRHGLEEVEQAVRRFVERELLVLLHQSRAWQNEPLSVGTVVLAGNRILMEFRHAEHAETPAWLTFEYHARWFMAGFHEAGWLPLLNEDQARTLALALGGLYKYAGIDLVREQLEASLPVGITTYEIRNKDVMVWLGQGQGAAEATGRDHGLRSSRPSNGQLARSLPVLEPRRIIFGRVPLWWRDWVAGWEEEQEGKPAPVPFPGLLGSAETS